MDEINYQESNEDLSDEKKRELGWKTCSACLMLRPTDQFYKSARTRGMSYVCKKCHRTKVRSYRNIEGSYNYSYRRMEKQRRNAKKRGIEYTLTVADYDALKEQEFCEYCKDPMDVVSIDRKNNDLGYTPENTIGCCFLCNRVKGNIFTAEEMYLIGKGIKMYNKRMAKLVAIDEALFVPPMLSQKG